VTEREDAAKHYRRSRHEFDRFPFRMYRDPAVRDRLIALFNGKCAYCESTVGPTNAFEIEHHRPKLGALNLDGSVAPDHYWWLAAEWANLFPICMYCNRSKRTRFPVAGERAEPETVGKKLERERPLLLDPCIDGPASHLVFLEDGTVAPLSPRGEVTIDVLALNRDTLTETRREAWKAAGRLLTNASPEQLRAVLASVLAPDQPYLGMLRQLSRSLLEKRRSVPEALRDELAEASLITEDDEQRAKARRAERGRRKQSYSVEADAPEHLEVFFSGKKFIEWVRIEDFKAIRRLHLKFPPPRSDKEPWLTLLGENGTGKSSVLQAIALALMGQRHANELGLDASTFVRRDAPRRWGRVQVKLATIPDPIEVQYRRSSREFKCKSAEPKVLLLGYGATRLLRAREPDPVTAPPHVRIRNLFDPTAPLSDVESWLLDRKALNRRQFDAVTNALKDLLLLGPDDSFKRDPDRIEVIQRGECPVPLRQLSDGFQSVVALAADVMKSLLERFPAMDEAEGIVLVDEIETHLHPAWKIQIVERLRRAFPRVAFIVTTHDPLCLKGLDDGEIVLLRRDEAQQITAIVDVPSVNHLRADQILTSPLFGLPSTRGDDTTTALQRYAELLEMRVRSPHDEQELSRLVEQLKPEEILTAKETPFERIVEQAVHNVIELEAESAVQAPDTRPGEPSSEEIEVRRQLNELLKVQQ
jgi:uncharacterized protein (TIGR02646 family)